MILLIHSFQFCIILCNIPKEWSNMYSSIKTALLDGIHSIPITVEVDINTGLPIFDMVGNLSPEVREAKERVKTALHNCGINIPANRITINMIPADVRKTGTGFDLPIAIALLICLGLIEEERCRNYVFVGELSLKGQINPVRGILPIITDEVERGNYDFIIPADNRNEANLVPESKIYAFNDLWEVINFINKGEMTAYKDIKTSNLEYKKLMDFSDINGQKYVKRACEVAASGMHNILMIGTPGSGKTMMAERLPSIMPPLTEKEKLELSKIYSVCGLLDNKTTLLDKRPFRSPHHSITNIGLVGGGSNLKPGEISLAHNGVLFLDELTEFKKDSIEVLRQPLEDHEIHLTRANNSTVYPANFLLVAAMNPCNCGYFPDMQRCRCSEASRRQYLSKISQPLLDRIDLCVSAETLSYSELISKHNNEASADIRERVLKCHDIQLQRFKRENFRYNSQISADKLEKYCGLNDDLKAYMEAIYQDMMLTARTYHKILRVARTIADMSGSDSIELCHLKEALSFRSAADRFWGGMY